MLIIFHALLSAQEFNYDIVIYGGSSSGVIAAVQASRLGKTVIIIEPGKHLGGMTSHGLGWIDVKNVIILGGLTREYFHRVKLHYDDNAAWLYEPKHPMKDQLGDPPKRDTMWIVEPHVAEQIFNQMADEAKIPILFDERLERESGVSKDGSRIQSITLESGKIVRGRAFIDASYEGDLMAAAGVSYHVGRESNDKYGETMNGVQINIRRSHMPKKIDPYITKGTPDSGPIARVCPNGMLKNGEGDRGIQAYNYRMCLTDVPENRVMVEKPPGYDENNYELLFRAIEGGINKKTFFKLDLLPNRKTDSNNSSPFSTDFIGMNWEYPEADYDTRKKIAQEHETWQRGLVWTLQNHSRVPDDVKAYYAPWGLPKDEFVDNNNWPPLLYVREARRMVADQVITEHTAMGETPATDCIGFGSYELDSHYIQYCIASDGFLVTDGGFYKRIPAPFSISYRTITPKAGECDNLLVPVCLSASHVGYGSVRMEPTFMILGQSAATAASLAIDLDSRVQDVPYDKLQSTLTAHGQILQLPKKSK